MKKYTLTFLLFSFFLLSAGALFSQSRFIIKDDAYVVLNTASTSESIFVVLCRQGGPKATTYHRSTEKGNINTIGGVGVKR